MTSRWVFTGATYDDDEAFDDDDLCVNDDADVKPDDDGTLMEGRSFCLSVDVIIIVENSGKIIVDCLFFCLFIYYLLTY